MALFKICRGKEANLPSTLTNGYAYFCTDTTNFYIDHLNASDTLVRSKISSKYAEKLRYSVDGTTVEIDPSVIELNTNKVTTLDDTATDTQYPSAKAAKDALDQKLNTDMGIAEAAVGDYISVNAIDENGVPTGYDAIKPPVRSISWLIENYPDVCAINVATKMQGIIFDLSGKYSKIPNGIYILDNNFNSITFYKYSIQNDRIELLGSISRNTITFISIIKNDDDSLYRIGTNKAIAYVSYDGETQIGDFKFIVTKEEVLAKTNTTEYIPTKDYHPATKKYVDDSITTHNTADDAHNDIRTALSELTTRLNALADSDDDTLDQLSEIVAYIKSNKTLIDAITTSKVSVDDIVDNLTSTDVDKPLSANQGKILKELIESSVATLESTDNKVTSLSADSTDNNYPSAKAVYDAIQNADYIPVAGGEFNFQNPIGYNNVSGNAWVFHSTSSKVTDPYGEEVIYDIGIAGNTVLACSHTDTIQDYRALYMRPEQVQVLDNSISGDHRHGYLTPYRLVFQRYNNGYKNFNINAETDRTVICNDQKLIDFNQTRLENLGTPIEDNDAATKKYVDDSIASMTNGIKLIDQVNGYNYIVSMRNGTLVSACAAQSISITTNPTKMSYMDGDHLNSAGMVVTATCEDGTTREITGFTCDNYVTVNNPVFVISYTEGGITCYTNLIVTVTAFDPAIVLTDFEYTDNGDGTYTITDWKETYNGEASTEMIIPDNEHIIL